MAQEFLEINNLDVGYGEIQVIRGVSIYLNADERIGLFGLNGHGKTTLLRTISGLLRPWNGTIRFRREVVNTLSPREIVDRGIIHVSQGNMLFPRMTVLENLSLGAYSKRAWKKRTEHLNEVFELFPSLAERKGQLCRTLSGGERQMVSIGVGLMGDGRVLMLDEPTFGLAPKMKSELRGTINKIASTGVPLLLVEQDFEFMMGLSDRLYLIEQGRVALESTPDAVNNSQILEMYFGRLKEAKARYLSMDEKAGVIPQPSEE